MINLTNLDKHVLGSIKFARKQLARRRMTGFGLTDRSRVKTVELPHDVPMSVDLELSEDSCAEMSRKRSIIRGQIREFTENPKYVELIERRLFLKERIPAIADELGINRRTAGSVIKRAKDHLGLVHA